MSRTRKPSPARRAVPAMAAAAPAGPALNVFATPNPGPDPDPAPVDVRCESVSGSGVDPWVTDTLDTVVRVTWDRHPSWVDLSDADRAWVKSVIDGIAATVGTPDPVEPPARVCGLSWWSDEHNGMVVCDLPEDHAEAQCRGRLPAGHVEVASEDNPDVTADPAPDVSPDSSSDAS